MKDYDYLEKLSEWEPFIVGAHVILLEIIFLLFPIVANYLIPWLQSPVTFAYSIKSLSSI